MIYLPYFVIGLHIAICVVYYIFAAVIHKSREGLCRFIIVVSLPFAGILFILISDLFNSFRKKEKIIDDSDLLSSSKNFKFIKEPDLEKEMNTVPIEEVLLINATNVKRSTILDLLKSNSEAYLRQLKIAINDPDTETSHYAAAALLEINRKYNISVQEKGSEANENTENIKKKIEYAKALFGYIDSNILDYTNKRKYQYTYVNLTENLFKKSFLNDEVILIKALVDYLVDLDEYARARECGEIFLEKFPSNELSYLSMMKLYYILGQRTEFQETLEKLRNSRIVLSKVALSYVRFWIEV